MLQAIEFELELTPEASTFSIKIQDTRSFGLTSSISPSNIKTVPFVVLRNWSNTCFYRFAHNNVNLNKIS